LIEWCAGLPAGVKLRGTTGKWLLREAARARLPASCTAPGKRGFTVPLSKWFQTSLHGAVRDALLSSDSVARTRFGEKAVRRLLDDHLLGRTDRKEELYSLWVLDLWRRRFRVETAAEVPSGTRVERPQPTRVPATTVSPPP
jgi:asparagine synthase (glutamine-hydrolysing)